MGLGLSISFVIFSIIAIILAWQTNNYMNGIALMGLYAVIKIVWRGLTGKSGV